MAFKIEVVVSGGRKEIHHVTISQEQVVPKDLQS